MTFNKTVLKNGLRIITSPQKDNPAVTVLVLVEAGSKYETKDINGISHFLEHMVFKGTKKRPRTIDIAYELDSIGAAYNAFTWFEFTGYFAKVDKKHFKKALDVVSDIYLNGVFDENEIEKERGPVTEEINMNEDIPMRKVSHIFTELLYGNQPAGWSILGTKENIKKISREDFFEYKKNHYVSSATTVVVTGAIDEKDAILKIKEAFKNIPHEEKKNKVPVVDKQKEPDVAVESKKLDQTHFIIGSRGYDVFDERKYTLGVLADILGGGMSSRLFQIVREEMGAAYYVGARTSEFTDHGYLAISAGVGNEKFNEVVEVIIKELKKIKNHPVSDSELKKSKDHMIGQLMLGLETSDALADFYGSSEILTGSILTPEEFAEKIESVTAKDILEVASDVFRNDKINLAAIGPVDDSESLREIIKIS